MADGNLNFDTKIDTEGFEKDAISLKDIANGFVKSIKSMGLSIKDAFNSGATDAFEKDIITVQDRVDALKEHLYYLEKQGLSFGDSEYDESYVALDRAERELAEYKAQLISVNKEQNEIGSSAKSASKGLNKTTASLKKTNKSAKPTNYNLRQLTMALKMMVLYTGVRAISDAVKEGFQNLVKYSSEANKSASEMSSSLLYLKNSFATAFNPIMQTVVPYLTAFIDTISQAVSKVGQFFTVLLTGKTTFTQATKTQEDYAKSIKSSANEAKKALSPFDELNTVASGSTSGSIETPVSEMFEEVEIDKTMIGFVSEFKDVIEGLKKVATPAMKALKKLWDNGLSKFKDFAVDGVVDFYEKFLKPVGKWVLGEGIPKLADACGNLFKDIDWGKLNDALERFWTALSPFAISVGEGLLSFIKIVSEFLKPIIAKTLDLVSDALDALAKAIDNIPPDVAEALGGAIGGIAAAILLFKGATAVSSIVTGIKGALDGLIGLYTAHPILVIAAAFAALAAAVVSYKDAKFDSSAFGEYIGELEEVREKAEEVNAEVDKFLEKTADRRKDAEEEAGAIQKLADEYLKLADEADKTNGEQQLQLAYAEELVKKIPELKDLIDDETGAYRGTREEIQAVIDKTKEYYLLQAAREELTDIARNQYEVEKSIKEMTDKRNEAQELLNQKQEEYNELYPSVLGKSSLFNEEVRKNKERASDLSLEIKVLVGEIEKMDTEIGNTKISQEKLNDEWDYATGYIKNYSDVSTKELEKVKESTKDVTKTLDKENIPGKAKKIIETFNNAFKGDTSVKSAIGSWLGKISDTIKSYKMPNIKVGMELSAGALSTGVLGSNQKISAYASGNVIPANYGEFLAILGDSKEPEVVSPVSKIEEAVENVISRMGINGGSSGSGMINLNVNLDGKTVYSTVVKYDNENYNKTGKSKFSH